MFNARFGTFAPLEHVVKSVRVTSDGKSLLKAKGNGSEERLTSGVSQPNSNVLVQRNLESVDTYDS